MAIRYIYPPTGESTNKEPWRWVAIYNDGSILEQFEVSGGQAIFHRFAEIEQDKLAIFKMVNDASPSLSIEFNPDSMELQHFYRNSKLQIPTGGFDDDGNMLIEHKEERIYYFGYKDKHGGYHLTGILPDNSILISDSNNVPLMQLNKEGN